MSKILFMFCTCIAVDAAVVLASPDQDVFDDVRRIGICVIGAAIGAFLSIAVFPPSSDSDENKTRRLSAKFGASMLGAIAFSPAIMQQLGLPKTPDYLMGVSAFVAVFAVALLHLCVPKLERLIERFCDP